MTVALYARRKGWPLEGVTVWLRHARIHASDCAECETKHGMLDRIESDLRFAGPVSEGATLETVLSNAFSFGGISTAIVLSRSH